VCLCSITGLSPKFWLVEVHAGLVEAEGVYDKSDPSERQIWSRDDLMRRVWSRIFLDQPRSESPASDRILIMLVFMCLSSVALQFDFNPSRV
jgi:hypothetical protein